MRGFILAVIVFVIPFAANADYQRCSALFAATPGSLSGHSVVERFTYPQKHLGFAVRFEGPGGAQLTVYFYDLGRQVTGSLQKAQFNQAISDMLEVNRVNRGFTNPQELATYSNGTADGADVVRAISSEQGSVKGIIDLVSVGRSGACIVKTRYTVARPFKAAQQAHLKILKALEAKAP